MALSSEFWSGLFGGVSNLLSSGMNIAFSGRRQYQAYQYAKKLQEQQYKLQQKGYLEGPTNARQGMVNAGYNPILALSNGSNFAGSVAGGSPVSAPNAEFGDIALGASNAYRAFQLEKQQTKNQTAQTEANVNNANAQADLNREQALTEQAKRIQMEFQNAMYDVEKHLKEKELSWADRKFYSEIYDNMQRAENYGAMASIARYNAQINAQNAETNAKMQSFAEQTTVQEQKYREEHPLYNWFDRWSKAISPWAMPVVLGTNANSQPNTVYSETASFDKNGTYKGHTRTTTRKTRRK